MFLTHHGHSCLLVEAGGARILIDPGNFSDVEGVADLDAILITHAHPDHADPAKVRALLDASPGALVFAEPGAAATLREHGVTAQELHREHQIGGVTVTAVGDRHAQIHPYLDRIGNRGLVLDADGEPSLFHPGDSLDAEPGAVDILCVPVTAPWSKVADTIAFVRRVAPAQVVPIHDGIVNETGRAMYLNHIGGYGADGGIPVRDLRGAGRVEFTA